MSFCEEFKYYISKSLNILQLHLFFQFIFHLYPIKLSIIFFSFSLNFLSSFSPVHLHFYPIKLSILFFSRSSSLLFHQNLYHIFLPDHLHFYPIKLSVFKFKLPEVASSKTTFVPEPRNQSVSVVFQL